MAIRVVVVDDNPHVSWNGRVHPVNATFHHFLAAVLDVPGSSVASVAHAVPLRPATGPPRTLALDDRLTVVATEPFDGIAGFLRRAPAITRRNAPILRAALADADLLWLKVPASNALVAAVLARLLGKARFVYVAGSAGDVVRGQRRGLVGGLAARVVAAGYDGIGRLVAIGGARAIVGQGIVDGAGVVTSLVEAAEIRDTTRAWPRESGRLALAWAGRLAAGKGLETVIETIASLRPAAGAPGVTDFHLVVLGDGPDRERLETFARSLGVADRVRWFGYVADRARYLDELAAADAFVFPSPAEGFPKVVLDAMAAGLPVIASPSGTVGELVAHGLIEAVRPGSQADLAAAVRRLAGDADRVADLRRRGTAFAAAHTRSAEAARLVDSWRVAFPGLPWA